MAISNEPTSGFPSKAGCSCVPPGVLWMGPVPVYCPIHHPYAPKMGPHSITQGIAMMRAMDMPPRPPAMHPDEV